MGGDKTCFQGIFLHAYIDVHSQRLIYERPGDIVQAISILKSQCANMEFSDQSRYNRMFQQVVQKGGDSANSYIKYFKILRLCKFKWKIAILSII